MKTRDLATLLVFVLGLGLLPSAFGEFVRLGSFVNEVRAAGGLFEDRWSWAAFRSGALSVATIALNLSLVFAPNWWTSLVPLSDRDARIPNISTSQAQTTLVALLGLGFVVWGLSDMMGLIVEWHFQRTYERSSMSLHPFDRAQVWPWRVTLATQIALGLILIFRARGLVNLWHQLRASGKPTDAA